MKKNGFVSMTLVYTFLILFLFLMLAILNAYSQQNRYIDAIDQKIDLTVNTPNRYEYCPYMAGSSKFYYAYTGSSQAFVAGCSGKYKIELWGADGSGANNNGGKGAYTSGELILKQNDKLYFYVGEHGKQSSGVCSSTSFNANTSAVCYSGGGSTDVRLVGDTEWNDYLSLPSRIMVAGGGGGAGFASGTGGAGGGNGIATVDEYGNVTPQDGYAGPTGENGLYSNISSKGGAVTSKQTAYFTSFGSAYVLDGSTNTSSSGGGGFFAGESKSNTNSGGGSSFISGHFGCVAVRADNSSMPREVNEETCVAGTTEPDCAVHYSNYIFSNSVMKKGNETDIPVKPGGSTSDGYAVITFISE